MKKISQIFLMALLCVLGPRLAQAKKAPWPLYELPPRDSPRETRQRAFETLRVDEANSSSCVIGGKTYRGSALRVYFEEAQCQPCLDDMHHRASRQVTGIILWALSALSGFTAGSVVERLTGRQPDYTRDEFGTQGMWIGGAVGLAAGSLFFIDGRRRAKAYRKKAAKDFNDLLFQDLQLSIAPQPGGAKLGFSAAF